MGTGTDTYAHAFSQSGSDRRAHTCAQPFAHTDTHTDANADGGAEFAADK